MRTVFYSKADVFQQTIMMLDRDLSHLEMASAIREAAVKIDNKETVREIDQTLPDLELQKKAVKAARDDIQQMMQEYRALAAKGLLEA